MTRDAPISTFLTRPTQKRTFIKFALVLGGYPSWRSVSTFSSKKWFLAGRKIQTSRQTALPKVSRLSPYLKNTGLTFHKNVGILFKIGARLVRPKVTKIFVCLFVNKFCCNILRMYIFKVIFQHGRNEKTDTID